MHEWMVSKYLFSVLVSVVARDIGVDCSYLCGELDSFSNQISAQDAR